MKNDMLEVFSCLEDHLGWRVRVNYYTQSLSSFCQKTIEEISFDISFKLL